MKLNEKQLDFIKEVKRKGKDGLERCRKNNSIQGQTTYCVWEVVAEIIQKINDLHEEDPSPKEEIKIPISEQIQTLLRGRKLTKLEAENIKSIITISTE